MDDVQGERPAATATDADAAAPPVKRGLVFVTIALALLMMSVDSTIVATVLHALRSDLDTTINWAGWTLTAYSLGFVLMLPVSGKLAVRYGRRRVFIGSVLVFTGASLLCGMADNIFVLIGLRALQAAGGAGFTPSATGIIVDHFGAARDRAVGLFGSIFPIGAMIGPIFGGLFVTHFSWRDAFLVNGPIGLAVILLSLRFIPRDPPQAAAAGGTDIVGMVLLGGGLLLGMLGVAGLGEADAVAGLWAGGAMLAGAVLCGALFFRHVGRSRHPFIAPEFIHGPGFGAVNLANLVYSGIPIGAAALIPLYAANRYGIGAFEAGALLVAQGVATVVMSGVVVMALRRLGYRRPIYVGGIGVVLGLVMLALEPLAGVPPYVWLAGAALLIGAGSGTLNPATRNAGLQLAPRHSSTLAALRSLAMQIGTIVTVSGATAIVSASAAPGVAQAWAYGAIALVLVVALPVIARVPEHRGAW